MRAFLLIGFLALAACSRHSSDTSPESKEIVFDDNGRFIRFGNEKLMANTYPMEQPELLLTVTWGTVAEFVDPELRTLNGDTLYFYASGLVTLIRYDSMRARELWRRYYAPAEAESLFDAIIPTIEQFQLPDLRARPENCVVHFHYLTPEGVRAHDCLLPDLTPITALLVHARLGGAAQGSDNVNDVQDWVRKRFRIFPPKR